MSETVQIALITFLVGPAVLAVVNWLLNRSQREAIRRIDNQVTNDHEADPEKTTNLREDMDEKHSVVVTIVNMLRRDVGGMRQDIRQLREDLSGTQDRVHELETTQEKRNHRE